MTVSGMMGYNPPQYKVKCSCGFETAYDYISVSQAVREAAQEHRSSGHDVLIFGRGSRVPHEVE